MTRSRTARVCRTHALLISALLLPFLATPPTAEARSKRYGIEARFVQYDRETQTFELMVTSRSAVGFGGSTVGARAPEDVEERKRARFSVKPEGAVISRTVIKSLEGTGLDNSGTQEGFDRAVQAMPTDRSLAFSIEANPAAKQDPGAPAYIIRTVVIKLTEAEIRERLEEWVRESK